MPESTATKKRLEKEVKENKLAMAYLNISVESAKYVG